MHAAVRDEGWEEGISVNEEQILQTWESLKDQRLLKGHVIITLLIKVLEKDTMDQWNEIDYFGSISVDASNIYFLVLSWNLGYVVNSGGRSWLLGVRKMAWLVRL